MKLYAPDYYTSFKCIADKCKNNCCIGWEIDIDSETLNKYKSIKGDFGKRLNDNIITSDDSALCFRLTKQERCPFLSKNNLCEIIIELGEDKLCQICTDHPRFRNYSKNHTEIGLGLCCEAAADLILNREEKTKIIELTSDESHSEADSFKLRTQIFDIIQNRTLSFKKRFEQLCLKTGITVPNLSAAQWSEILLEFEQLDNTWTEFLKSVSSGSLGPSKANNTVTDTQSEQLLHYFVYRHMSEENPGLTLRFALLCTKIIHTLAPYHDFTDLCRMFSSEIEYSEENTDFLMDF